MTKRERYLKALHNQPVDQLTWAPNFDYWLAVNQAEGTMPPQYRGMSRNDIVRAIGGTIWNRAGGMKIVVDPCCKESWKDENGNRIHEWTTPEGNLREVYSRTEGPHRAPALTEHFVKEPRNLATVRFVMEATHYEPDYEACRKALKETGDDGIVLNGAFCVPFIQFAKNDAGYNNAFFMWMDHRDEVDALIQVYHRKFLEGYRVLAGGPCDVVATGDNMDGVMISPAIFKEYAIPFYREAKAICTEKGKLFEGHWCGRTQNLLPLVPGCGLDVIEAIVTKPMADITLAEAIDRLEGKVVLQGGVPSVLVCEEGGSRKDFEKYLEEVILPLCGRRGFVLGMSDNVPPNADFSRVEAIAGMVAA
jgi:uroporphyrinogen-III decarboxylase